MMPTPTKKSMPPETPPPPAGPTTVVVDFGRFSEHDGSVLVLADDFPLAMARQGLAVGDPVWAFDPDCDQRVQATIRLDEEGRHYLACVLGTMEEAPTIEESMVIGWPGVTVDHAIDEQIKKFIHLTANDDATERASGYAVDRMGVPHEERYKEAYDACVAKVTKEVSDRLEAIARDGAKAGEAKVMAQFDYIQELIIRAHAMDGIACSPWGIQDRWANRAVRHYKVFDGVNATHERYTIIIL